MFRSLPHITAMVIVLAAAAPAAQAAVPDHLTVTVSPRPAHVGQTVTARVVVRDASGAVVANYAGAAGFTDTAHAVPAVSTTFAGGIASATFRYNAPVHADAFAATAGALSATSGRFDVLGPVTKLTVSVPSRSDAASPFTAVVAARDAAGSLVTDYRAQPSWTDRAGAFAGTQPSAFANGVSRTTLPGTAPLRADVLSVHTPDATADSRSFTRVGGLDHVELSVPAWVEQNAYFPVVARARDAAGNLVTGFNGPAYWDDSPSGLDPAIPNEFVDGVSTTNVRVAYPIHYDVIDFHAGGLETFSRGFDVLGAPDHLDISGTPAEATVGTAFTVVSTLRDAANNVLANVTG